MNSGASVPRARALPQLARVARTLVVLLVCLLALSTLLSRASFGPIGALMLVVLAMGLGVTLGVPMHAAARDLAGPYKRPGHK